MSEITVLDGGMGKELERIGAPFRQPEWSALALMEEPEMVRLAHQNFVDAGAEVIITNTYAVVPFHIGADRFAERGAELVALAGRIAREVADGAGRPVRVAGSLPPLFGSYEPARFDAALAPALWKVLVDEQAAFVDCWLAETLSSLAEFEVVADLVAPHAQPFWASFTVDDDAAPGEARLRSGEPMAAVAEAVVRRQVDAVLFNCSQPERFSDAVDQLRAALGPSEVIMGAYANSFPEKQQGYAANEVLLPHRADLTPERYAEMAAGWVAQGVTIVGGCCGIGPDHIAKLSAVA